MQSDVTHRTPVLVYILLHSTTATAPAWPTANVASRPQLVRHGACQTTLENQGCGQDFQLFELSVPSDARVRTRCTDRRVNTFISMLASRLDYLLSCGP